MIKERFITALTVAPALSVVLISAIYQLMLGSPYLLSYGAPLVLGYVTFIAIIGSLVLAVVYRRAFTPVILSVLFGLCFVCNLVFITSGTTDLLSDGFFEMIMLVFSLPSWSYMSVASSISYNATVPALVITGVVTVVCLAVSVVVFLLNKKENK